MIRFIILIGYMGLMMYLQISGELNQYINIHYNYLAVLSMLFSFYYGDCPIDFVEPSRSINAKKT
jgi:uncharacterized membrane protein YcgQ (UPF0703/DUF1980 family)